MMWVCRHLHQRVCGLNSPGGIINRNRVDTKVVVVSPHRHTMAALTQKKNHLSVEDLRPVFTRENMIESQFFES